jgi:hypothetical protein
MYSGKIYFFYEKVRSVEKDKTLAGSKITVDTNFCLGVRNTQRRLIPYLMDAKGRGHRAFLKKDRLVMNLSL